MVKTDSHAVLMELFARDQEVRAGEGRGVTFLTLMISNGLMFLGSIVYDMFIICFWVLGFTHV